MRYAIFVAAALSCAGCGSGDDGDGADLATSADLSASADLATAPPDLATLTATDAGDSDGGRQWLYLRSGTYAVSNLRNDGADGCMQNLTPANFTSLAVTNDGMGTLGLGEPGLQPLSFGTGKFVDGTHGQATLAGTTSDGSCTFYLMRTSDVTLTADDTLEVRYRESESNQTGTCAIYTVCNSAYDFTLHM